MVIVGLTATNLIQIILLLPLLLYDYLVNFTAGSFCYGCHDTGKQSLS